MPRNRNNNPESVRGRIASDLSRELIRCGDTHLQLLEIVGKGAYGCVYRARDILDPWKIYAVKALVKAECSSYLRSLHNTEFVNHFKVGKTHPNVLGMCGKVEDKEHLYFIIEYCSGGDMAKLINPGRALGRKDVLIKTLFLQLLEAVKHCHDHDVYHRDLKPDNVMVNKELTQVFLSDFGLSTRSKESKSFHIGTKPYMSPECLHTRKDLATYNTARNDIWSLGVILVNMVVGRYPWDYATAEDPRFRLYLQNRSYFRDSFPVSRGLERILKKVFVVDQAQSIDIMTFHKLVKDLDTFYMTDAEIARASGEVQNVAKGYLRPPPERVAGQAVDNGRAGAAIQDNNAFTEGVPIWALPSTELIDDRPSLDSDTSTPSSVPYVATDSTASNPGLVLPVRQAGQLLDDLDLGDSEVGWKRGEKTPVDALVTTTKRKPVPELRINLAAAQSSESSSSEDVSITTPGSSNRDLRTEQWIRSFYQTSAPHLPDVEIDIGAECAVESEPRKIYELGPGSELNAWTGHGPLARIRAHTRRLFYGIVMM